MKRLNPLRERRDKTISELRKNRGISRKRTVALFVKREGIRSDLKPAMTSSQEGELSAMASENPSRTLPIPVGRSGTNSRASINIRFSGLWSKRFIP
jgi:hypothetical protein